MSQEQKKPPERRERGIDDTSLQAREQIPPQPGKPFNSKTWRKNQVRIKKNRFQFHFKNKGYILKNFWLNNFGILNFVGSESESEESDSEDSGEDSDHRRRDSSYSEESDEEERGHNEEYAYPEEHDKRYFNVKSHKKNEKKFCRYR